MAIARTVVISHEEDQHALRVIAELHARGHETYLLDIAKFPSEVTLSVEYEDPAAPSICVTPSDGAEVDLGAASSVWWRRPQFPDLTPISDPEAHGFAHGEWHEALNGLYQLIGCPWMNPLVADDVAHRKALQLKVASEVGFRIPRTLMTSNHADARSFIERNGLGGTIYKIFAATHQVWRETRLVTQKDLAMLDTLHLAPVIFQEYIPAAADIRVTVVGQEMYAMAIDVKGTSYEVDFRLSLAEARTYPIELPRKVATALGRLMKRFGLVYGAVDFRLTEDGEYVFLEINPAGEFLFAEVGAGLPITGAVASWLMDPSRSE